MFSSRLKELRTQHSLSQSEVARILKVARSTVSMYEKGDREPNQDILKRISVYFGVPVDFLIGAPPFDLWDAVNSNRAAFFSSVPILRNKKEQFKIIWGIDINDPESVSIQRLVSFISHCVETISLNEESGFVVRLNHNFSYLSKEKTEPDTSGHPTSASSRHLLTIYNQLNDEGQEKLVDYAEDLSASGRYIKTDSAGVVEA